MKPNHRKRETRLIPMARKIKEAGSDLETGDLEKAEELRPTIEGIAERLADLCRDMQIECFTDTGHSWLRSNSIDFLWEAFELGRSDK